MRKYYIMFKNAISESLVYRTSVFLMFFSQFLTTIVFIFLWTAIYSEGGQIGNYTLDELVGYFVLVSLVNFTIFGIDISWRVGDDIRLGNVTNYILKPISYYKTILAISFGKSCFNFCIIFLILIPFIFLSNYFSSFPSGIIPIAIIVSSLAISFFIFTTFSFIVGLYTFWAGDVRGFNYVMRLIMLFFSGAVVPLDLLPKYITVMGDYLPFKSVTWIPVSLMTGKISPNFGVLYSGIVWVLILFVMTCVIYNLALRQYEGLGA